MTDISSAIFVALRAGLSSVNGQCIRIHRKMKCCTLILLLLFCMNETQAQKTKTRNCREHALLNKKGMLVLGGWSLLNAGYSGFSLIEAEGRNKYFHQMNLAWSGVNLGLAIPFYLAARKEGNRLHVTTYEPPCSKTKAKKIFLFNTFLDLAYIGTGLLMMQTRSDDVNKANRLKGFGSSIVLQGSFLFTFDLGMFLLHRKMGRKQVGLQ